MQILKDRFCRQVTYMRVSVTDRCNYRCVYCMPAEGIEYTPKSTLLTFEEIVRIVSVLAATGVSRVRLTGGEPLVRRAVPDLIRQLYAIDGIEEVVMTTNAHLLARFATDLADAGLKTVNVSVDSLDRERFARITRGGDLSRVLGGIEAARDAGIRVKLNTVPIRGFNEDEIADLVRWGIERGITVRFIEFMPIGPDTLWAEGACFTAAEIRDRLSEWYELVPEGMKLGKGPARYWRVFGDDLPSWGGSVGIIAAVTECFCADCNRIRLTSQGGLRACLADDGEVDLRDVVRAGGTQEDILEAVQRALWGKKETHAFDIDGGYVTSTQMVSIGG